MLSWVAAFNEPSNKVVKHFRTDERQGILGCGIDIKHRTAIPHSTMALARSLNAVRSGVLAHLRVSASQSVAQHQAAPASWQFVRAFAGTYLDKNDVTERVLSVVKNFDQKVDQSKV